MLTLINQIKHGKLKIISMVVLTLMALQCYIFCPCTYAECNRLMQVLKDGVNLTVEDIKPLVESNPGFVNETNDEYTVVYYALLEGKNTDENRAQLAMYLIEKGASIGFMDSVGNTPLDWFAEHGCVDGVRMLLDRGADPNTRNQYGDTPLHMAVTGGHDACFSLLLERGADPNIKDRNGDTPLHMAAAGGHEAYVRLLLERGANPSIIDHDKSKPLDCALEKGHDDCARLLIVRDRNSSHSKYSKLLRWAVEKDYPDCVQSLLELEYEEQDKHILRVAAGNWVCKRDDPDLLSCTELYFGGMYNRKVLFLAIERGRSACVRLLLNSGADPSKSYRNGDTPLRCAVRNNKADCVRLLLDAGADPDQSFDENETLLHYAAKEGYDICVRQLLEAGADPEKVNKRGETPLQLAKEKNHTNVVQLLRLHGAKEEESEKPVAKSGSSDPEENAHNLYTAIKSGDIVKVRSLLECGVDPNHNYCDKVKKMLGKPYLDPLPLCLATKKGNIGCVRLLLKKGANPNCKDSYTDCDTYMTPLYLAINFGHEGCARLLLEKGADPNLSAESRYAVLGKSQKIPLCSAASLGAVNCARLLLEKGADPNFIDMYGAPLHYAVKTGRLACVKLLLNKGADPNCKNYEGKTPLDICSNSFSTTDPIRLQAMRVLLKVCGGNFSSDCVIM